MKSNVYLASKPRYEILDGLRGVAAMLVVAYHLCSRKGVDLLTRRLAADGYYESSILGPEGIQIELTE